MHFHVYRMDMQADKSYKLTIMMTTNSDKLKELGITTAPEKCNFCQGDGKDFASKCPVCGGLGSVLVVQPPAKCATCGGDGKDFLSRCEPCGGTGWAHSVKL
jgi:DnaJ-class molecular chaperone